MILLGLLLLAVAVAVVIAVVGVLSNIGSSHLLTRSFEIFGYHITGSTGRLLLIGVILGAAGMLGSNLLLAGLGRGIKPGSPPAVSSRPTTRSSSASQPSATSSAASSRTSAGKSSPRSKCPGRPHSRRGRRRGRGTRGSHHPANVGIELAARSSAPNAHAGGKAWLV